MWYHSPISTRCLRSNNQAVGLYCTPSSKSDHSVPIIRKSMDVDLRYIGNRVIVPYWTFSGTMVPFMRYAVSTSTAASTNGDIPNSNWNMSTLTAGGPTATALGSRNMVLLIFQEEWLDAIKVLYPLFIRYPPNSTKATRLCPCVAGRIPTFNTFTTDSNTFTYQGIRFINCSGAVSKKECAFQLATCLVKTTSQAWHYKYRNAVSDASGNPNRPGSLCSELSNALDVSIGQSDNPGVQFMHVAGKQLYPNPRPYSVPQSVFIGMIGQYLKENPQHFGEGTTEIFKGMLAKGANLDSLISYGATILGAVGTSWMLKKVPAFVNTWR